jgi:hypothetical protein
LTTVRTGKGDSEIYTGDDYIFLKAMFGGIKPSDSFSQVLKLGSGSAAVGSNNIDSAQAVINVWTIKLSRNPDIDEKAYFGWESKLLEAYEKKFGNQSDDSIKLHLFTIQGLFEAVVMDINHDFSLIFAAILLVCFYTFLFLGSFSPTHCRAVVAITGLFCIMLAYLSGFGLLYLLGAETTGVHQLMPFLLVGIGADDMFVLCNAIDQTDLKAPTASRVLDALGHAGPAITITSLTNALAFAFGATTSLIALRSFCLYASICILMLYLLVNTVFLAVVVWDTRRVEKKTKECCGLCCCDDDTIICCAGKLLA